MNPDTATTATVDVAPHARGASVRLRHFLNSYRTEQGLRALRNLIGLTVWTGVSQLCAFGMLLMLTSVLDSRSFGSIVFGLSVQNYLIALGTGGLYLPIVRDLTQKPKQADETISAFFSIVFCISVFTGITTCVISFLLPISADEQMLLGFIAVGSVFASLGFTPLYDANHRQSVAAMLSVPADLLMFLAVWQLGVAGILTVPVVGAILATRWLITLSLQALVMWRWIRPFRWRPNRARMQELLKSGWPIFTASVLYMLPLQGSVVLVRLLNGEREAAIYGLAFQVAQVYLLVAWLLTRVLQPHILGPHGLERSFVKKLFAICFLILVAAWVGGVAGGWLLTHQILNEVYRASFPPLVVLLLATLAYSIAMILTSYLARLKIERTILQAYILGAVTFVAVGVASGMIFHSSSFEIALLTAALVITSYEGYQILTHLGNDSSTIKPGGGT